MWIRYLVAYSWTSEEGGCPKHFCVTGTWEIRNLKESCLICNTLKTTSFFHEMRNFLIIRKQDTIPYPP
uniref:Uncharacterized protein n=1 Tax=Steinernema glaseri TaxID=37863 RepID=A0A1I7YDP9_9BILA